jgi:predicted metalloendopeptidase
MVFPAGLLQPFFFNVSFPPVINYGGIGMIMGHELTHGFDSVGRKFDGNGSLVDWWPDAVNKRFMQHASCFERQYRYCTHCVYCTHYVLVYTSTALTMHTGTAPSPSTAATA